VADPELVIWFAARLEAEALIEGRQMSLRAERDFAPRIMFATEPQCLFYQRPAEPLPP
jgi:hypothetical protein